MPGMGDMKFVAPLEAFHDIRRSSAMRAEWNPRISSQMMFRV